jgi:hypothetical protein
MGGRLGYVNSHGSKVVASKASTAVLGRSLQRNGRAPTSLGLRMGQYVQVVNSEELEVAIQVRITAERNNGGGYFRQVQGQIIFPLGLHIIWARQTDHVSLSCMVAMHRPSLSQHANRDTQSTLT